jgi:phage tail sheath gpL-like
MKQSSPDINIQLIAGKAPSNMKLRRQLIITQGLSTGSFTSGALIENIPSTKDDLKSLCGANSLAYLDLKAFKDINKESPLSAIILADNGSGVAATGSIAFTVSSPKAGYAEIIVGSDVRNKYSVEVLTTSTATSLGDTLVSLISNDENSPVTAVNSSGTVTFTARNKGTQGNSISIFANYLPFGVTTSITAFSSGATDPSLTGILNKILNVRYDISFPKWALNDVRTHLENKFNTINQTLESYGVYTLIDSYANIQTALQALTYKTINPICLKTVNEANQKGGTIIDLPSVISAQLLATDSLRLVPLAPIAEFMQTPNFIGGLDKVPVPFHNVKLTKLGQITQGTNWTNDEIANIEALGGSVLVMDDNGVNIVTRERLMSVYKKNNLTDNGNTFRNLNTTLNSFIVKDILDQQLRSRYSQAVLIEGTEPKNVSNVIYVNERAFKVTLVEIFVYLHSIGLVDLDEGGALQKELEQSIKVIVDVSNKTISADASYRNMGQLQNIKLNLIVNS